MIRAKFLKMAQSEIVRSSMHSVTVATYVTLVCFTMRCLFFTVATFYGPNFASPLIDAILYPWFAYEIPELGPAIAVLWLLSMRRSERRLV